MPEGFWPEGIEEADKALRLANFEADVFPIWKGIEDRDSAAEAKLTDAQVAALPVMLEVLTLHRQDLAIIAAGIRVDRSAAQTGDTRKRAATSNRYGGWKQG